MATVAGWESESIIKNDNTFADDEDESSEAEDIAPEPLPIILDIRVQRPQGDFALFCPVLLQWRDRFPRARLAAKWRLAPPM
jgi:hypothetical protein